MKILMRWLSAFLLVALPLSAQVFPRGASWAGSGGEITATSPTYTPPGAGAYVTTESELNQRNVSVLDYMTATQRAQVKAGTATFDATAAFEAAEAYCSYIGGGTIWVPAGKYCANFILNTIGVNLQGSSSLTTSNTGYNYICPYDITKPALTVGDGTKFMQGGYVKDISLLGLGPNGTGATGLYIPGGVVDWNFHGVTVRRFTTYELHMTTPATYYNEFINFWGCRFDGGTTGVDTNTAVVFLDYGAAWVTAIDFWGCGIQGGVNEPLMILDSVIPWMHGGWMQGLGTGSGTNCVGIILQHNHSQYPAVWADSCVIELTGGGVILQIYETSASRKNISQYVKGLLSMTSGVYTMKSADGSLFSITNSEGYKIPYQSEAWQMRAMEHLYFSDPLTPATSNCYIRQDSSGRFLFANSTATTGQINFIAPLVSIGTQSSEARFEIAGDPSVMLFKLRSSTANTGGGMKYVLGEEALTLSGASTATTTISVPSGFILMEVQIRVDTAITSDSGATWSAAFSGGSTTSICTGQAFTKNTKANLNMVGEVTSGTTQVTFTPNAGTFTAGVVHVLVYSRGNVAMSNNP